jgi:CspA family cold shock protein
MNSLGKEAIGLKGKIKRLVRLRGFGFISAENGEEVFFHHSILRGEDFDALQEGTSVEFSITRGPKGPRAVYVIVAK